jgi:hypothetical protein
MRGLFVLICNIFLLLLSCKKQETENLSKGTCLIDSISIYPSPLYVITLGPFWKSFKYTYENGQIKEIRVYEKPYNLVKVHKFVFDMKNRLLAKEYFSYNDTKAYAKRYFLYNATGKFVGTQYYTRSSVNQTDFIKSNELKLEFENNVLRKADFYYWDLADTTRPPSLRNSYLFTIVNGNAVRATELRFSQAIVFNVLSSKNQLLASFNWLLDPVLDEYGFFDERFRFLPLLLNSNTTTTVLSDGGGFQQSFLEFRVSYNKSDWPESFSNSLAIWDYYYKNCK